MSRARELADLGSVTTRLDEVGNTDGALSNRNMIINGNMQIAQRGTSSGVSTGQNTYLIDRFFARIQGSTGAATVSRETDAPNGLSKSLKITVDTADSTLDSGHYNRVHQEIEGYNGAQLKWGTADAKPASLSFWVKSSVTGTYSVGIYNGNADRSYVSEYTISAANTWEYKTIYIAPITTGSWVIDSSAEFRISWSLGAGNTFSTGTVDQWQSAFNFSSSNNVNLMATLNATFFLTGVQLEVGDTATPFEHPRSYSDELARCQRYYEQINHYTNYSYVGGNAVGVSSTFAYAPLLYSEKRAAPSITGNGNFVLYDGSDKTVSGVTFQHITPRAASFRLQSTGLLLGRSYKAQFHDAGTRTIQIDAEL